MQDVMLLLEAKLLGIFDVTSDALTAGSFDDYKIMAIYFRELAAEQMTTIAECVDLLRQERQDHAIGNSNVGIRRVN